MHRAVLTGFRGFLCVLVAILAACSDDPVRIRTYNMGERVQAGPLVYDAFDTHWYLTLGPQSGPRIPSNRFLVVRISISNNGATDSSVPTLSLVDDSGQTIHEVSDGTGVPDWIGIARKVGPMNTEKGNIAFDATPRHYKLRVADETDQIIAYIDLPLNLANEERGQ